MTESEFYFYAKMNILWQYFTTRRSSRVDYVALFLVSDLVWSEQLTPIELSFLVAIYGSTLQDIVDKWIAEGVLERVMDDEGEAVRLAIFPPGSEELIDLLFDEDLGIYVRLMSDAKAAMGGSPSMKEVLREAIANWKWLQSQELELEQDSADHHESASEGENRGERE